MREQTSKANKTHGETNTKLYRAYSNMMTRCYNPNYKHYDSYGGRGISVCDEWKCQNGYENFSAWAKANGFKEDLTLDRIDVNGNYCPQNCRWTTMKVQQNNRTNNAVYEYNGQRKTMAQWSETLGIKYSRLQTYLREKGYTMDEVVKATFG